ncbi:hypothetical protein GWP43_11955 [Treponema vincentii]|uniref:Uncharacterized protein n=1 Tax=Treponema vincentii TaxID=69710 RepID=A0A6P1Y2I7_9SPIR|nr:DUF5986 family protein [Treponema vincentii]QHX44038.1 hypothetical protein GWP43_11955 [Treponema vincentii]
MKTDFYQNIYSAISQSIKEDLESYTSTRSLVTQNSRNFLKWDLINTNIYEKLQNSNIEVEIVKMGGWKFLLLLDKENNTLFSLMTAKRYESICSNVSKNAPLYLQSLVELNQQLGLNSPFLFDCHNHSPIFENLLNDLCKPFFNHVPNFSKIVYKLITFNTNQFDDVIGLNLLTLDVNLDVLNTEDLFDNIMPEYQNNIEQVAEKEILKPILKLSDKSKQRIGERYNLSLKSKNDNLENKNA